MASAAMALSSVSVVVSSLLLKTLVYFEKCSLISKIVLMKREKVDGVKESLSEFRISMHRGFAIV